MLTISPDTNVLYDIVGRSGIGDGAGSTSVREFKLLLEWLVRGDRVDLAIPAAVKAELSGALRDNAYVRDLMEHEGLTVRDAIRKKGFGSGKYIGIRPETLSRIRAESERAWVELGEVTRHRPVRTEFNWGLLHELVEHTGLFIADALALAGAISCHADIFVTSDGDYQKPLEVACRAARIPIPLIVNHRQLDGGDHWCSDGVSELIVPVFKKNRASKNQIDGHRRRISHREAMIQRALPAPKPSMLTGFVQQVRVMPPLEAGALVHDSGPLRPSGAVGVPDSTLRRILGE